MTILNFPFSHQLKSLFTTLLDKGDELRMVGGCVRDFLNHKKISDIDLACKYTPKKTINLLQKNNIKAIATGLKHGTVTALISGETFEITTLRKDVKTHGRRAEVEFIDNFYLDAKRRDFTINAMSIDFSGKLYDYFGGKDDLKAGIVKFIGNSTERIQEDYLRILRFFRFSCYYSNSINPDGLKAAIKFKDKINSLSADRIRNELIKIITHNHQENLWQILSVMQKNHISITGNFNLEYLKNLFLLETKLNKQFDVLLRFSALIADHKNQSLNIAQNLNFSNKEKKYISAIINPKFNPDLNITKYQLLELLFDYKKNLIIDSFIINLVTILESKKISNVAVEKFLKIKKIITNSKIPPFPINGNDLLKIGIIPTNIGNLLKTSRNYWIKNDFTLNKKEIIEFIKLKNLNRT